MLLRSKSILQDCWVKSELLDTETKNSSQTTVAMPVLLYCVQCIQGPHSEGALPYYKHYYGHACRECEQDIESIPVTDDGYYKQNDGSVGKFLYRPADALDPPFAPRSKTKSANKQ